MKKNTATYQPKRVTLLSLILRALAVVLLLTLAFGIGLRSFIRQEIIRQGQAQIHNALSVSLQNINKIAYTAAPETRMQEIRSKLILTQNYCFTIEDPLFANYEVANQLQIIPQYSPGCHSAVVLVNEKSEIVATNQRVLITFISFGKDHPDNGYYLCDREALGMPMIDQLFADYEKLAVHEDWESYVRVQITSAYIDRKTHTFIPHEGTMKFMHGDFSDGPISEETELSSQEIHITIPGDGYELVDLYDTTNGTQYPHSFMTNFFGESKEVLDRFNEIEPFQHMVISSLSENYRETEDHSHVFTARSLVYIDDQPYTLMLGFIINDRNALIMRFYRNYILLFAGILTLIAALWVWRRHTLNQARYAFEDYQRDLTNHLAHDIKTPLMAIGGYAENIMECDMTAEEQKRYLGSILENVAFTDSIINRTLQLNGQQRPQQQETIAAEQLLHEAFGKYAALLEDKHIAYKLDGSAEITAERTDLEMILENLVSNAVKYTPENGSIEAVLDKKCITLTNTVTERIDIKKLKQPFYRGDAARSNSQGTGLGLALADRAAQANGGKLMLSCTETQFRAELKFR